VTRTFTIDDINKKLHELERLVCEHTNPDGSGNFDLFRVIISLELAEAIITGVNDIEKNANK